MTRFAACNIFMRSRKNPRLSELQDQYPAAFPNMRSSPHSCSLSHLTDRHCSHCHDRNRFGIRSIQCANGFGRCQAIHYRHHTAPPPFCMLVMPHPSGPAFDMPLSYSNRYRLLTVRHYLLCQLQIAKRLLIILLHHKNGCDIIVLQQ